MDISKLRGVGQKRTLALRASGINTVDDLLGTFPRSYIDRSEITPIAQLEVGKVQSICATAAGQAIVTNLQKTRPGAARTITRFLACDESGQIELLWFNQAYVAQAIKPSTAYHFSGKCTEKFGKQMSLADGLVMYVDEFEDASVPSTSSARIVPVYSPPHGFSQKYYRGLIQTALCDFGVNSGLPTLLDAIPHKVAQAFDLMPRLDAIQNIHFPKDDSSFLAARRRLVFEEFFFMLLALSGIKKTATKSSKYVVSNTDILGFTESLPYTLTPSQHTAIEQITADMASGRRMNRLVQGDVGCGKSVVAFAAAYVAVKNGFQAALMMPTQTLARQQYNEAIRIFEGFETKVVLLDAGLGVAKRREVLSEIEQGLAKVVVGTHSLFGRDVVFPRLGLVITDEQHRFGVNQRLGLSQKGDMPHCLVMSATPIPRTLGLIVYGDLDICQITHMPPDRLKIDTYLVTQSKRSRVHGFIRKQAEQGGQTFVICPAIESASESKPPRMNVIDYAARLAEVLGDIPVGCLHGRQTQEQKVQVMEDFAAGRVMVLVATTIVEVGINVPKATLMVIEDADRFGLSQLHQLRGRVGRSDKQSYCVLISETKSQTAQKRLRTLTEEADGFALAAADLSLRGGGDFFGTKQHGMPNFVIANLYRDGDVLEDAQMAVSQLDIAGLDAPESVRLIEKVSQTARFAENAVLL